MTGKREPRAPSETGVLGRRPYWLWLPDDEPPWPAALIIHGAGSCKENHGDFGRACAARGWAALAYDQRGHGDADDEMGPGVLADAVAMAVHLAGLPGVDPARVCVRGSSLGGFVAIHAAAASDAIAGAIAICPADAPELRRGLRDSTLGFRAGPEAVEALDAWLGEHELAEAVALMGAKPLLLLHADGDEQIPSESSRRLHRRAAEPRKLIVVPGGHHRSVQHDAELHGVALRWMERALAAAPRPAA